MLRLLKTYLRPAFPLLAGVIAFQAAQAMLTLYLPRISADIIDKGVIPGDTSYIWARGVFMMIVTLLQMVCSVGSVYFAAKAAMGLGRDIRRDLFHRVTDFSAREVGRFGAPSLITRITNDVQQVQMMVLLGCTMAVTAPITAIGGSVMAIREDAGLSWLLLVFIPGLLLGVSAIVVRMTPAFRMMQDQVDTVNQVLREQITGIRVVRAFVREPAEVQRFDRANGVLTMTSLQAGRLMAFMFPIVMFVVNLSSIAVLWFGARRINAGHLSIGAMIAFLSYMTQILFAVMMATFMVVMLPRAAVSGRRIRDVLETESSVLPASEPVRWAK